MQMDSIFQLKVNIFRMNRQKSSHMFCLQKTHLNLEQDTHARIIICMYLLILLQNMQSKYWYGNRRNGQIH